MNQEVVLFYQLLQIKVIFVMSCMQKKSKKKTSVPPNYLTESFNGFGPIYDESLYMFCSSVGNYFLTLSFKSMCWDHTPVQIRWPSCPQNNVFKAKRNTYKLSKITRSHSDIKSICSCFWCFLEFSGRPCWPKTLLPNWLCVREPGSYICLCVCGRVGGERGRGACFWGWRTVALL